MNNNTNKLYIHEALLYAIDFFTQGFDTSQIINYAFDFTNEILTLNSTAVFLKEGKDFVLHKSKNYKLKNYKISASDNLKRIAQFHGDIIKSNFKFFLDEKEISIFKPKIIIPLIVKDKTLGFIISDGKVIGKLDDSDYSIATTLMRLINKSLENTLYADELKQKSKELDLQIFNLFFINQTTKTLLSELDIESVYTLCTDIIGEVTCSKITTFGLYDDMKENIVIKGYRDIFSFTKYYSEFELLEKKYDSDKIILNFNEDREEIKKIFKNWKEFEELQTEYIIMIVKDSILGFITISKPVNDRKYDALMLNLVESLASIIYIAITNANLFKKIKDQKSTIEKKYNILSKLNKIIKNINSSSNIEGLSRRIIKTLNIGFGIDKGFIIFKQKGKYKIMDSIGFDTDIETIEKTKNWNTIDENGIIYEFSSINVDRYFNEKLCKDIGESNCLIISPIEIGDINFQKQTNLGYIVILKTKRSLEPQQIVLIDTISGSIAPVIKQLNYTEQIQKEYILNQQELFLKELEEKIIYKERYNIDFKIYYKLIIKKPFVEIDDRLYSEYKYYYFDNHLFILSEENLSKEAFDGCIELDRIDEVFEFFKGRPS